MRVHNFRSIKDLEIQCDPLMVLLGPNNHGKSNVLAAVEFALTTGAKPTEEDFFALRDTGDDTLWVELVFCKLTEQERNTFNKYLRSDSSVKIRKEASLGENSSVTVGYWGYRQEPSEWWLASTAVDKLTKRKDVEKEAETIPQLRALIEEKGTITKKRVEQFQSDYIQEHREKLTFSEALEVSPLLGLKNVAGGVLPDFYLVPAVRDLCDETKIKGTTTFGRLLQRAVQEMAARDKRFIELRSKLDELVNSLNISQKGGDDRPAQLKEIEDTIGKELKSWGVKVAIEVTPPELEKIFELGTQLHIDDGLQTLAEKKGHGLQRAVIFAQIEVIGRPGKVEIAVGVESLHETLSLVVQIGLDGKLRVEVVTVVLSISQLAPEFLAHALFRQVRYVPDHSRYGQTSIGAFSLGVLPAGKIRIGQDRISAHRVKRDRLGSEMRCGGNRYRGLDKVRVGNRPLQNLHSPY